MIKILHVTHCYKTMIASEIKSFSPLVPTFVMLSLNCYLLDNDPSSSMFTIDISETKNVSILKDLIKEKMDLKEVSAGLVLWKVDLPEANFEEGSPKVKLVGNKPLMAFGKLSNIFSGLDDTHVHLVIKRPSGAEPG